MLYDHHLNGPTHLCHQSKFSKPTRCVCLLHSTTALKPLDSVQTPHVFLLLLQYRLQAAVLLDMQEALCPYEVDPWCAFALQACA